MVIIRQLKLVEWSLRMAIFLLFLGHGIIAIGIKPAWIPLITVYGFSKVTAIALLPIIGTLDIFVASAALIKPIRIVLIWAAFWAFITALSRIIAGEPIWEFIERAPNWITPLILLAIREFSRKLFINPSSYLSIFQAKTQRHKEIVTSS